MIGIWCMTRGMCRKSAAAVEMSTDTSDSFSKTPRYTLLIQSSAECSFAPAWHCECFNASEAKINLSKPHEDRMRSELVFGAIANVPNRFLLTKLASKVVRKLHRPRTRTAGCHDCSPA